MKRFIIGLLIVLLLTSVAYTGNQWTSVYDQSWQITVTDCQGNTTIYNDCLVVEDGLYLLMFMPNQGKIPTGNGPIIRVYRSNCTRVIMAAQ